ncbi:MAG: hypothetical protein EBZ77_14880, partial [Chitinophagia bacterium]|nr:hypothetical protein [Chitinophagia bacterium]
CAFASTGTYQVSFRVTSGGGVQSGYTPITNTVSVLGTDEVTSAMYTYPKGASTTTTTAFTGEQKTVVLALSGGDAVSSTIAVFASTSQTDAAPQSVCASATVTSSGSAEATCVFGAAGTWFLFVQAKSPAGLVNATYIPVPTPIVVSAYTDPASVTLTTLAAYVGVPTSVAMSLPAQTGSRRTITVYYSAFTNATNPLQCGVGDLYDGTVTATCTFATAGTYYVYVRVTSPATGTQGALQRATAAIVVSAVTGPAFAFPSTGSVAASTASTAPTASTATALTLTATGYDTTSSSTCSVYYVIEKKYTLLGSATLQTWGVASFTSCTFPTAGTYKLAFTVTSQAGVQSGYIASQTTVSVAPPVYTFVFPTSASTTTTNAFTGEPKAVYLALTGGDALPTTVAVFGTNQGTTRVLCASAPVSSTGNTIATCVFPSSGTWTLSVKTTSPDGMSQSTAVSVPTTVSVVDYTEPGSATLTTQAAYTGVPTDVAMTLPAQTGSRRTVTVYYSA